MFRLTMPGGWWADIRTEFSYGADARIAAAALFTDDAESFENSQRVLLQQAVAAAHLPDIDGNAVEFGPEMWDVVDGRKGRKVLAECRKRWADWLKDADPNDTSETSPASPQA